MGPAESPSSGALPPIALRPARSYYQQASGTRSPAAPASATPLSPAAAHLFEPAMQRCSCSAARCSGAGAPSAPARPAPRRLGLLFDPLRLQRRSRAAAAAPDGGSDPQQPQEPA